MAAVRRRREGSRVRGRTDGQEHVAAPFDIYAKELTIVGSYAGTYDTWPRAIELLAGGRFDPGLIVYSVRPLDEAVDAIRGLERDKSTVKAHIQAWR